jgi:DNA-binding transcriptional LysR family regulator
MDVAGHDDHPLSQYACPPVTTVAQNDDEIDRLAIRMAGAVREIVLPVPVTVNAAESYIAAARLGLGLIQIPRYHAEASIAGNELVRVMDGFPPTSTPVTLLYPRSRQLSPRVRPPSTGSRRCSGHEDAVGIS